MNQQHDHSLSPDLADQAACRTVAPTADDHDDHHHDHDHAFEWTEMARIALVAVAAAAVWFRLWEPLPAISIIGVAGLLVGGWPIYKEAFENLIAKRMTMELSMSIAILAAAAISEFFTALVITLFVLVAEVLEGMTVARGRSAIRDLLDFLPRAVSVRRAGSILEVDVDTLAVGDAVLVNPGGRIPVDGTVLAGHSFVDQARITGESMPLEKTIGAPVFAGSINQSGALEIRTERIGRDTSYGKIIEAVEQAERSRAPVQRLADRMAGYLVYIALAAAVLTYLLTRDIRATISVIIVTGACGIAAGTPLAILGGIGRAARGGAIIKGGLFLEQLGQINTVVLDKTGTLTYGQPEVRKLIPAEGVDTMALLNAAAAAELRSEHPLGKTIVIHAQAQGCTPGEPERFGYTPGLGIDATVDGDLILVGNQALMLAHGIALPGDLLAGYPEASEVFVARAGALLGAIVIADAVRPESRQAIAAIHAMGIKTLLLTGDAQPVANAVARELGITDVAANLLPEDKRQRVKRLVA
ncbi:MAG: cation-translocating P-type ATPase, partial [Lysobacter sp.]